MGTRKRRAAAASCAEIITIVTEIKTIVAANPENSTVTTLTTKITSVASTVTCTDAEKTSLATSSSDLALQRSQWIVPWQQSRRILKLQLGLLPLLGRSPTQQLRLQQLQQLHPQPQQGGTSWRGISSTDST